MKFDPDTPAWTAYAIGECDPADLSEFDRECARNPEAHAFAEATRATVDRLREAFAAEPVIELRPEQRRAIVDQLAARKHRKSPMSELFAFDFLRSREKAMQDANSEEGGIDMLDGWVCAESAPPLMCCEPSPPDFFSTTVEHDFDAVRTSEHLVLSPSLDDFEARRDHPFLRVQDHLLSTFSIDVDTASYTIVRKLLNEGHLPPRDAVRIEELVNYFTYDYPQPTDGRPIAVHLAAAPAPWNPKHHLVRVALKAKELDQKKRPPANLVFLVDASGSMSSPNRLPLVKRALAALAKQLDERDRIAIVAYASEADIVLPATSGAETQRILDSLGRLQADGSTAGGAGIRLAYDTARAQFITGGVNRVILCTDGDFNVGITQRGDLERLIEDQAKSGVSLTVLGFGMGNLKDATLELLANKGNGQYGYIDDFSEARRLLVDQMLGTLVTVAKDVKIQIEFNPAHVAGYRLIGYENRLLKKEDFNNDRVNAGDVGAGHTVTAFYELIPAGLPVPDAGDVDPLKYQTASGAAPAAHTGELLTAKLRYKLPDGDASSLIEFPLAADAVRPAAEIRDFRFAAAVAGFGMTLRDAPHRGTFGFADALVLAESDLGEDRGGYRRELLNLIRNAAALAPAPPRTSP